MTNFRMREPRGKRRGRGGRRARCWRQVAEEGTESDGLARLVSEFIPPEIFAGERERVYGPWVTFVAFLGQVLTRGSACRESVRRVQAWCVTARLALPDESTSAYCQARARLDLAQVQEAHARFSDRAIGRLVLPGDRPAGALCLRGLEGP